ncbi:MAG: cell division protein FtsZ, partial [Candidatus Dadabacteria bacterium]|nr:cell division protein FtsZ [Candidatus Dadabacteria bacterium]
MASFRVEQLERDFNRARIKVIGTGGGGGNAVNTMISKGLEEVEFIAVNTDFQDLNKSLASKRIQIGENTSRGLGSGGNPQIAKDSAIEDLDKIEEVLHETDMVFITAGMGGGTGTGVSPVIAEACRKKDILTVAIVTKPFGFEGAIRRENAVYGIEELYK